MERILSPGRPRQRTGPPVVATGRGLTTVAPVRRGPYRPPPPTELPAEPVEELPPPVHDLLAHAPVLLAGRRRRPPQEGPANHHPTEAVGRPAVGEVHGHPRHARRHLAGLRGIGLQRP